MNELLELAERCEKATAGSRELDAEIAEALLIVDNCFTASIDAAMTLVPEGWCADMGTGGGQYVYGPWARCFPDSRMGQSAGTGNRNAATAALALCAAALIARVAADASTTAS